MSSLSFSDFITIISIKNLPQIFLNTIHYFLRLLVSHCHGYQSLPIGVLGDPSARLPWSGFPFTVHSGWDLVMGSHAWLRHCLCPQGAYHTGGNKDMCFLNVCKILIRSKWMVRCFRSPEMRETTGVPRRKCLGLDLEEKLVFGSEQEAHIKQRFKERN